MVEPFSLVGGEVGEMLMTVFGYFVLETAE